VAIKYIADDDAADETWPISMKSLYDVCLLIVLPIFRPLVNGDGRYGDKRSIDSRQRTMSILTQQQRRDFLREHNKWRNKVEPSATDMRQMCEGVFA
jgi:hypothetical protein